MNTRTFPIDRELLARIDAAIIEAEANVEAAKEYHRRLLQARAEYAPEQPVKMPSAPPPPSFDFKHANIPSLVAAVMREAAKPLQAGEIVARVRRLRPEIAPTSIYPAVYRMTHNGRVTEEKGVEPRLYRLATAS